MRFAVDARPLGSAISADVIETELERLPPAVQAVLLCLAYDDEPEAGCRQSPIAIQVRTFDVVQGDEIARKRVAASPGLINEIGRFARADGMWSFVEASRTHRGSLSDLFAPVDDSGDIQEVPSNSVPEAGVHRRPRAGSSKSEPLDGIATETSAGYCDISMRRAFVTRALQANISPDEAEIIVDLELERLRVTNETVLLQRLESVLRRFTDDDARLDDKERRDAVQMVCRPSPGYAHGLRHDIADAYVLQFCRERRVKIKLGMLRWAVP
jgi:hypothetical protein